MLFLRRRHKQRHVVEREFGCHADGEKPPGWDACTRRPVRWQDAPAVHVAVMILIDHDPAIAAMRGALDPAAFAAEWAAGRDCSLTAVITQAAAVAPALCQPVPGRLGVTCPLRHAPG
jgi:hypothetical protein